MKRTFHHYKHLLFCVALFLIGMYLVPIKTMGPNLSYIPGDYGDSRLNNYFLKHGHLFFSGKLSTYWNAPFMYPEKDVITYSDNLLGTLPLYSVFRILGLDRESAYQGWIILLFALNFIAATYALNKLTHNLSLSAIGGYIFAFSLPIIAQMNHAQVFPRFIIPMVILWMYNFLNTQKVSVFFAVCLGISFQFYAGIYLVFILFIFIFFWGCTALFFKKQRKLLAKNITKTKILQLIGVIFITILVMLPLMYPYYERSELSGTRPYEEVIGSVPYIKSYFNGWSGSLCWSRLNYMGTDVSAPWDHILFPGGIAILCMILFPFIPVRDRSADRTKMIVVFCSFLIILLFTLQYNNTSLYYIIYKIPGFSSL